jgi:hypothetical protein
MKTHSPAQSNLRPKSSFLPSQSGLLQRKCACGGSAGLTGGCRECDREQVTVQRQTSDRDNTSESPPIAHEFPIQTKLTVGKPGDIYEREADRVASQVMSMGNSSPSIQPATAMKRKELQTKRSGGEFQPGNNLESRLSSSKGSGSPLSDEVRSFMEPRFGTDFSQVRTHTGGEAIQMNRELNAQAFTHQEDVYFGAGKSPTNDALTAHELTHVVQQTGSLQPKSVGLNINSSKESIQRKMNDGHDLQSTRFRGIPDLEDCYDDEARLTMNGTGQPGTRKVQSGTGVQKVKEALVELGYLNEIADENYTQATWDAVKALKKDKGLGWETMGDVGPGTMAWLDNNFKSGTTCPICPSLETRPSPCLPCPQILPEPQKPEVLPGPVKPPTSPLEYCVPFSSKEEALEKHAFSVLMMKEFISQRGFGSEVHDLYMQYLNNPKNGNKGTLPPRKLFAGANNRIVQSFRQDLETIKQKDRIMKLLADEISSKPDIMPLEGKSTEILGFRPILSDSELLNLPMSFKNPADTIPGFIAGGFGKGSSDAGDDIRNVDGSFVATNLGYSTLQIAASFTFDIFDAVDFCPGNPGGLAAQLITINLSKLEATPDIPTYDVPFEVIYGLSDKQSF